jgi:predicted DNA-binding transcriptional regulator YafY
MGNVTTRLFSLIQLLQTRAMWTASELADALDVSVRTIHRYMETLEEMGLPIYAERGRGGGFALLRGYKIPPLIFTAEEATVLYMGANLMRELWGRAYQEAITSARAKLDNVLPNELRREVAETQRQLVVFGLTARDYAPWESELHLLRGCIADRKRVRLRYQAFSQQETCRDVDPYALSFRSGFWYLVAYCHLRDDMRTFRVDRIQVVEPLATTFDVPRDFNVRGYLEESMRQEEQYHVVVRFDERVAHIIREYAGHWTELTDHSDGSVTAQFDTQDLNWAAGWALSYGATAQVLEPPELVERVQEQAEAVLRQYRREKDTR